MARIGIHAHTLTPTSWAAKGLRRTARFLARMEGAAERHWPFATYAVLTIATSAYVAAQMARI